MTSDNKAEETWKPVVGHEGKYEVSDHGRVRSLGNRARILKPFAHSAGYPTVALPGGYRRQVTTTIHRLVLTAFVGPRPEGCEGCHGDGNPMNNHLSNLRWDTVLANAADRTAHGTQVNLAKTHCPRGHELREPNLIKRSRGWRACRACKNAHSYAHFHKVEFPAALADEYYRRYMPESASA